MSRLNKRRCEPASHPPVNREQRYRSYARDQQRTANRNAPTRQLLNAVTCEQDSIAQHGMDVTVPPTKSLPRQYYGGDEYRQEKADCQRWYYPTRLPTANH